MSLTVSNGIHVDFKAPQQTKESKEVQQPQHHAKPSVMPAVSAGTLVGAAGGGALGAFGYAKPVYKDIDQVFTAKDIDKILAKVKDTKDEKLLEFVAEYNEYKEECQGYKEHLDNKFKDNLIPLDDYKTHINYQELCDDIPKFEERTKKINDFLVSKKDVEFSTRADFEKALGAAVDSPTVEELNDLYSYLDKENKGTFKISEGHINTNKIFAEYEAAELKANKAFFEEQFKLAKDGKISKSALFEFHNKGYLNSILENTEKPTKVQWYNAIEKHLPTNKVKPGLIGAAIGAVAVAAAVAAYSKFGSNS